MLFPKTDIYALTDSGLNLGRSAPEQVRLMLEGGIRLVQYREKKKPYAEMLAECREIRCMTAKAGCCFIVNDHAALALECEADGLHIGQSDSCLAEARKILGPNSIIGVSARTLAEAQAAEAGGADYLGVGALFATATKEDAQLVSFPLLREIADSVSIPVVGIGGINARTVQEVVRNGITCCAVVSALTLAANIPAAAQELRRLMRDAAGENRQGAQG